MVTLEVGNEDSGICNFLVHESVLCGLAFFKSTLQGGSKETSAKLIKMPEDDPIFVACLVEFLYSRNYQEPVFSVPEDDETYYKSLFKRKLYHARVVVLGEKYEFERLCNEAASYMRLGRITVYPEAASANDENLLEYVVQFYGMSGPSSALRVPKPNAIARSSTKPIVWDTRTAAIWIGRMWRDAVQRSLVEEAFRRCPDLAQDLLVLITSGFVDKFPNDCGRWDAEDHYLEGQAIYL